MDTLKTVETMLEYVLRNYVFNAQNHEPPDFKAKELFARGVSRETGIPREVVTRFVDEVFK